VAAFVASGMADAGFGVEVPAREFKLEFLPTHRERYFFVCHERSLASPDVRRLIELLQSSDFQTAVDRLPGYQADASGTVLTLDAMFPALGVRAASR
jgi:molybdate-binding protein